MSKKDDLKEIMASITEAEANLAIVAIMAYRKKRNRTKGNGAKVGLYDEYMSTLSSGDIFSADDVVLYGISVSSAYRRIAADVEAGKVKLFKAGRVGRAQEPSLYEKA